MYNSQGSCAPLQSPLICLDPSSISEQILTQLITLAHAPLHPLCSIDYFLNNILLKYIRADSIVFLADSALYYFMTWFHLSPQEQNIEKDEYKERPFSPSSFFPFNVPQRTFNCFLNDPPGLPRMSLLSSLWRRPSPFHSNSL